MRRDYSFKRHKEPVNWLAIVGMGLAMLCPAALVVAAFAGV